MGGACHLAVVVAVELHEFCIWMSDHLHHAPQICVFFVAAQHFEFSISGNQQQRWGVFSNVKQRSHVVDDGLFSINALFFANGEMSDRVSTEWDESRNLVRIDVVCRQPVLVQSDHAGEISAGRVTADENSICRSAVLRDISERPCDRRGRIINAGCDLNSWAQSIADSHNSDALLAKFLRDSPFSAGQSAAMKPDDCCEILDARRIVDIQLAALLHGRSGIVTVTIDDVLNGCVFFSGHCRSLSIRAMIDRGQQDQACIRTNDDLHKIRFRYGFLSVDGVLLTTDHTDATGKTQVCRGMAFIGLANR